MMKTVNIDLGEDYENYASCCPSPEKPEGKRYPTFYIESQEGLELPKDGKMTIEFKRVNETKSESDPGGERYSCTIQVQKIVAIDGDVVAPTAKYDKAGDALDAIVKALTEKAEEEGQD